VLYLQLGYGGQVECRVGQGVAEGAAAAAADDDVHPFHTFATADIVLLRVGSAESESCCPLPRMISLCIRRSLGHAQPEIISPATRNTSASWLLCRIIKKEATKIFQIILGV